MGYNTLSGTVLAPLEFIPGDLVVGNILSGNLSTSDASSVINVPRVTNPTDNALVTNVSGDANSLTCETNLTFDGSELIVTGYVTASIGLSASYLEGDGSRLTGISTGGGDGIFTIIDGSHAYVTSSLNVGGTASPTHQLVVSGTISSSVNVSASAFYGTSMILAGGLSLNRATVTSHITASKDDYYLGVDSTSAAIEIRLLNAALLDSGQTYVVKDEGGNANNNNITIRTSGSQTIDGQNYIVLISPHASISIYCNGTDKYFIY
tara:strand:- start:1182 stop:1976 length:795 start_codon:yes stop_codon:yes gene_type:complete